MAAWIDKLNDAVAQSFIGRHFQLEGSGHRRERKNTKFTTELRAGLTIFFAMVILNAREKEKQQNAKHFSQAYIISVNASIISESGGPCVCEGTTADPTCDNDADYMSCVYEVKLDLIMATSICAMICSVLIGIFANLPLGMAPG